MTTAIALMTLRAKTFKELAALKKLNLHTEAYQAAAKALGLTDLAARFGAIFREQERGSLTPALYSRRRSAYEELMSHAKRLLSTEQYDRLYMCF